MGQSPAAHMCDNAVGAGLQMALFDVMGKIAEVPVCHLLGTKVRDAHATVVVVQPCRARRLGR